MQENEIQNQIHLINNFFGIKFLKYILGIKNYTLSTNITISQLDDLQNAIINNIHELIVSFKEKYILENNIGEFSNMGMIINNDAMADHISNISIKTFSKQIKFKSKFELNNYIISLGILYYPILLSKHKDKSSFFISNNETELQVLKLLKGDPIGRFLTIGQNLYEHTINISTDSGLHIGISFISFTSLLLSKSFRNCCNKTKYDLSAFVKEIEISLNQMRDLAEGKTVMFSTFTTIYGLRLENINFTNILGSKLYQCTEVDNPSKLFYDLMVSEANDDGQSENLYGCVLEVFHDFKVLAQSTNENSYNDFKIYPKRKEILDNLLSAISLSTKEDRGISILKTEFSFPLVLPNNISGFNLTPHKLVTLNKQRLSRVKIWMNLLVGIDKSNLNVALNRIKLAIYDRVKDEDAFVDLIIAWEAMLGDNENTTFKVSSSITKLLFKKEERKSMLKKINKLYGIRSKLVHGVSINSSNLPEHKILALNIAIEVFKRILKNNELKTLKSSERVKKILVFD